MTKRDHPEQITHWVTSIDGFNKLIFNAPVLINGRWENKKELIRNDKGDSEFSNAIVYIDVDASVGDYIAQGDQTLIPDPTTLQDSHEIKQFDKIPSLRPFDFERKAVL